MYGNVVPQLHTLRIAAVRKTSAALGYYDEKLLRDALTDAAARDRGNAMEEKSWPVVAAKRNIDVLVSLAVIVFGLPFHILVAALIKLTSRGPVLFEQERIGRDGRTFRMYKYRTMLCNNNDEAHRNFARDFINGNTTKLNKGNGSQGKIFKMVDDPRVTSIGKFLRKTSLDELPQFINVLKGEMSLVGPRPPLKYELELYKEWHKRRLAVKPGLTGLWQVSGRSTVPFDEMVELDIFYIENWSLLLDIKIILRTAPVMLRGFGAY